MTNWTRIGSGRSASGGRPAGAVFGGRHVDPEDLAVRQFGADCHQVVAGVPAPKFLPDRSWQGTGVRLQRLIREDPSASSAD